jgi:nitrate reductase beta subunit
MDKIEWGPNWEEILGTEFRKRARDKNFDNVQKEIYGQFENTFMFYLPRLCEHCLNPACVAACPSGSIYKREEDGIVLVDQDKCRGWRMCISSCPYKKVFYNWESGKAEKCIGCYPRVESGMPTVCSESCVGRIRYNGIMLYDADKIETLASTQNEQDLYEAQCNIFLDPNDPAVIAAAQAEGINEDWIIAAQKSPIYKMAIDWKIAFPMHPEFRTLPMVWYVPPLSPVQSQIDQGNLPVGPDGAIPLANAMRLPVQYLANLLTAGKTAPIQSALNRLIAMRSYQRSVHVEGEADTRALEKAGITEDQAKEMYRYLAIANYEDRFVIPTGHEEVRLEDFYGFQGQNGFTFGNDSSAGISGSSLFPERRKETVESKEEAPSRRVIPIVRRDY